MLNWLNLRDLAIVDHAQIDCGRGFSVITGETGAGKSIIVNALGLLLGDRAELTQIRHGTDKAEIAASFSADETSKAGQWLLAHDYAVDEECLLRRIIFRDQKNKAFINDRPVLIQTLQELGELLVDIHGQHQHQSLLQPQTQRQLLDAYAQCTESANNLATIVDRKRSLTARVAQATARQAEKAEQQELLRYQIDELNALSLTPEGLTELQEKEKRSKHLTEILEACQQSLDELQHAESASAVNLVTRSELRLHRLLSVAPELAEVTGMLTEARLNLEQVGHDLRNLLDQLDWDPASHQVLQQQLDTIHQLARKHRVEPEGLFSKLSELTEELSQWQQNADEIAAESEALRKIEKQIFDDAGRLRKCRLKAASSLEGKVNKMLAQLAMSQIKLRINLEKNSEIHRHGYESAEFLISSNDGSSYLPLRKIASGGELSRISLALQVSLAQLTDASAMVFDEVDVGIGGGVAEVVGQMLSELGQHKQVLCITHLPQVAACGSTHVLVDRSAEGKISISTLNEQQRIEEIARMLGGIAITEKTRAHAREMLQDQHIAV